MALCKGFNYGTISFDSANDTYYSGDVVSGKFQFEIDTPITFQEISVRYLGEATVLWEENETRKYYRQSNVYNIEYKGREEYFNFVQNVAGPTTLHPGTHTFNFHYQMPYVVPSSYDGKHGKVWYRAIAYIVYPGMIYNPEEDVIKIFHVVAPLDLNELQDAQIPIEMGFEEIYSCCLCQSEPLSINIRCPVSGFCPGQAIPLEVTAENNSSFEVQKIIFTLRKIESFHSIEPKSDYALPDDIIATCTKGAIPCNAKRTFNVELVVPDMVAPNLTNCTLINVDYFLKVEFDVSGCNDGSEEDVDIHIGLIPLRCTLQGPYTHPMADRLPRNSIPKPESVYPTNTPYPTPMNVANLAQNQASPQAKPFGFVVGGPYPGYPHPVNSAPLDASQFPPPYSGPAVPINATNAPSAPPS